MVGGKTLNKWAFSGTAAPSAAECLGHKCPGTSGRVQPPPPGDVMHPLEVQPGREGRVRVAQVEALDLLQLLLKIHAEVRARAESAVPWGIQPA